MKRSPMKRSVIRSLRPNEPVPTHEPKRYRNSDGYVRLRWLVAPNTYVEEYEHRIAAGRPPGHLHVHHINGVKDDNRPENVEVLTASAHAALHGESAQRSFGPYRSRTAMEKAKRAEQNRAKRDQRAARICALYAGGLSTIDVGRRVGLDASGVSRVLARYGVRARTGGPGSKSDLPVFTEGRGRKVVYARSDGVCERCGTARGVQWHHRLNRSQGGTWQPSNGLHLCLPCHEYVTGSDRELFDQGWRISREDIRLPAEVPVAHWRLGLVLLDDVGDFHFHREPAEDFDPALEAS